MTRDDGWRFLIIGRRLERLCFLAQALASFLRMPSTRGPGALEWLLELADSIITYRSRYSRPPELLPVLDLLVFDDSNPHGVVFQASVLARYLERMVRELGATSEGKLRDALQAPARLRSRAASKHLQFSECRNCSPCADLATLLEELDAASGELSDWLACATSPTCRMSAGRRWRSDHGPPPVRYHVLHETRYDYGSAVSLSQQQLHLSPRVGRLAAGRGAAHRHRPAAGLAARRPRRLRQSGDLDRLPRPARPPAHPFGDDHRRDAAPAGTSRGVAALGRRCATVSPMMRRRRGRRISRRCVSCSRARMSASSMNWPTTPPTASRPGAPVLVGARALMAKIFRELKFDPEATTVSTPVMEVLEKKRGVCQDFAHLMIACLRASALPPATSAVTC